MGECLLVYKTYFVFPFFFGYTPVNLSPGLVHLGLPFDCDPFPLSLHTQRTKIPKLRRPPGQILYDMTTEQSWVTFWARERPNFLVSTQTPLVSTTFHSVISSLGLIPRDVRYMEYQTIILIIYWEYVPLCNIIGNPFPRFGLIVIWQLVRLSCIYGRTTNRLSYAYVSWSIRLSLCREIRVLCLLRICKF